MTAKPHGDAVRVYRRLLTYIKPYGYVLLPALLATVAYALLSGVVPFFLEDVMAQLRDMALQTANEAAEGGRNPATIPLLIALVFGIRILMDFLLVYGLSWVGRSAVRDLRRDLYSHYLYLPAEFYDRNATGDLVSRLTFNTEQVAEAISSAVIVIVRDSFLVVIMVLVMISFSPQLTLILAIVGPTIAILIGAMSRTFRRYSTRIQNSMGNVTQTAEQALQGHQVVKVFAGQKFEQERFEQINGTNFRLNLRLVGSKAIGDALTQYVVILGVAAIIFLIFSGWLSDDIDSPEFMGFITAVGMMLTPLKRLINTNVALQRGLAAAASVFGVLDEPMEMSQAAASSLRCQGKVEYRSVSFRYGEEQSQVLSDISFRVESGSTVAFVGHSGSGKSTLVRLLPRFYDVGSGSIFLDDKPIADYPLQDLRHQLSFVSQDVVLFDDTIAGNIAYGSEAERSRSEIEEAAEAAFVTEFSKELPQGLDAPVGERGLLLSGGQRQRIAIARALLKNAPVLILDEATSALDAESERRIQEALSRLMRGRTTLVIAHRLSTVEQADEIIVMKDGRIVERGKHAALLAAGAYYAALYGTQFAD